MLTLSKAKYEAIHPDFRGVWKTERWDIPNWAEKREKYLGKRTMVHNDGHGTCLLIEGIGFEITEN